MKSPWRWLRSEIERDRRSLISIAVVVSAAIPLLAVGIAFEKVRGGSRVAHSDALTLALLCLASVCAILVLAEVWARTMRCSHRLALIWSLLLSLFAIFAACA